MTAKLYTARYVLPITSAVIDDGAVLVEDARIVAVGKRAKLAVEFPEAATEEFGQAALLPGFVNAHSHLELTAMRGYLEREERDFFAWLRKLTVARRERMTPDDLYVSAAWGAIEAARAGITCVADASDAASASLRALSDVGLRGIVYQEAFGPDSRLAREQFKALREKTAGLRSDEGALARLGVSPHAPYTVSAPLLEFIAEFAISEGLPLMMHAAESEAESELMLKGRGPFADGFAARGIEWNAPGVSTIQYLAALGLLRARPLLAHCIRVDEADILTIKQWDARVAHCPKSNAKLGHGRAPLARFVAGGLKVGLGSDSVASNNTCDLLEEARFAALLSRAAERSLSFETTSADEALTLATLGGALALGLESDIGSLEIGKQADLTIVSLDGAHQLPVYDPAAALVFASSGRDVLLTVVAGKEIYRDGRALNVDEQRFHARLAEIAEKVGGSS
ncbi:MAG: aminodeoxyfutalosine deaminase [Blastocatellia bacterium]|jgi:5-methylthioadenosine/S-adenosylhomocysteine deaminase|nr:aminodeoxyfutalosine deaminase [Blastocatellia bacterium]